jgi:hypothetical protein
MRSDEMYVESFGIKTWRKDTSNIIQGVDGRIILKWILKKWNLTL